MSLQGTIDTFEVPDILRLLASTKKTGQLTIAGNRGNGSVWVDGGDIIHSEASAAPWAGNNAEVIFELLRYSSGDFIFYGDIEMPETRNGKPEKVDPVLNAANSMLREWEEIEKVVPSLASPLRLASGLPEPIVEINEASWKMIVGIGSGTTVGELGNLLEQSEIVVSRNIKQLIEAKLVDIERADPVLPSGAPLLRTDVSTPQVSYSPAATKPPEVPVEAAPPVVFETEAAPEVEGVVTQAGPFVIPPSTETVEMEAPQEAESVTPTDTTGADTMGPDGQVFMYSGDAAQSPFDYGSSAAEQTDEDIDLDDPVQLARAIEQMDQNITRSVTLAARAGTVEERDSILSDLQQQVTPLDFAVIQRFVYSLTA